MIRLNYNYFSLPSKSIPDKTDFYKSGIKEATKVRNLITTTCRIFITNEKNIDLTLLGENNYMIDVYSNDVKKSHICTLIYIPGEFRLDIFDGSDTSTPVYVWKGKNCVVKNVPNILNVAKAETIFLPLISIL